MHRILFLLSLMTQGVVAVTTELSGLSLADIRQSYQTPQADATVMGGPIRIAGRNFASGVGTHAASSWTLKLDARATRLSGHVGVTDSPGNESGSCEFIVRSGERILWRSGLMREGEAAKEINVSLVGEGEVTLEVTEGGDNNWSDHAAWCCRIEHNGAPLPLRPPTPGTLEFIDAVRITNGSTVQAADFGIIPGSDKDAGPALRTLLAKLRGIKDVTVILRPGSYNLSQRHSVRRDWPQSNTDVLPLRNYAVILEDLEGVTLKSEKALFNCTGTFTPFAVVHCQRVTIDGIHIDWPRPPMSQAEILSSNGKTAVIRPHPETPLTVRNGQLAVVNGTNPDAPASGGWGGWGIWAMMEWDPNTGCPAYQRGDMGGAPTDVVALDDGTFRVTAAGFKTGNVMLLRHDPRSHCGMLVHRSAHIRIQRTYLYACCGLGYLLQHSKHITLVDTHAIPRPESGRLFSGHDDGFQISGCGGKVVIHGCTFAGLMDDPINVHGTYLDVTRRVDARTLEVRFAQVQSQNQPWADAGDIVTFSNRSNLLRKGEAQVTSWQLTSTGTGRIHFDRDLPQDIGPGWVTENMTMSPEVEIRDCKFLGNRARGLLVTTPRRVVIEKSLFRSSGSAILINGDCNGWFESGTVTDVLIRGNRFEDCLLASYQFCDGVISIIPTNAHIDGPVHRGIRIEGNTFVMFDAPLLYARATADLRFTGNHIERVTNYKPWHGRKSALTLENCSGVVIEGNTAKGEPVSREVKRIASPDTRIAPDDVLR